MRTQCIPQHSRPRTNRAVSIFFFKSLTGRKDGDGAATGATVCLRFLTNFVFSCCMLSGAVAVVRCRGCDDVSWWWAVPRPAPPRTTKYYYYILYLYTKYKPRRSNDTDYSRVASPVTRAGSSWSWWETRTPPVCSYFFDTVAHAPLPSHTVAATTPLRPPSSRVLLVGRCCCFCWHRRPVVLIRKPVRSRFTGITAVVFLECLDV